MTSDLVDSGADGTPGHDELPLLRPPLGLALELESTSADTMTGVVVRRATRRGRRETIHVNRDRRWVPGRFAQRFGSAVPVAAASSTPGWLGAIGSLSSPTLNAKRKAAMEGIALNEALH